MDENRRKTREKRYRNRIRIGVILLSLFVIVLVVSWLITGHLVVASGFLLLVGAAYLGAGLWERKELQQ